MPVLKPVPDFGPVFLCRMRGSSARCEFCERRHVALCDYPTENGKTCDKRLCGRHRNRVGSDRDFCPDHMKRAAASGSA